MTAFDKYRKAAEKRDLSVALTEMEDLLIQKKDLFIQKIFTGQLSEGEANRRLLNLLKVFFLAKDVSTFFTHHPTRQQAAQAKALATKMAQSLKACRSQNRLNEELLTHLRLYFLGTQEESDTIPERPKQQSLFP